MKILFFGTGEFAVPSFEQLVAGGHAPVVCVTRPDREQGRGQKVAASPIKHAAERLGVPLEQPADLKAPVDRWRGLAPDLGIVIDFGKIVSKEILAIPRHGVFGLHPSLLPTYRGASPIPFAILRGDRATGVTVYQMDERMDAGAILFQREALIEPRDTADTLQARLATLGAELLVETIGQLEHGKLSPRPQDEAAASYAKKFSKDDGRIDWTKPADELDRMIRALQPWPGAYTTWRGELLKVWVAEPVARTAESRKPGEVIEASSSGLLIATGKGALAIRELQPAAKRRMTSKEFLAGHSLKAGDAFLDA